MLVLGSVTIDPNFQTGYPKQLFAETSCFWATFGSTL